MIIITPAFPAVLTWETPTSSRAGMTGPGTGPSLWRCTKLKGAWLTYPSWELGDNITHVLTLSTLTEIRYCPILHIVISTLLLTDSDGDGRMVFIKQRNLLYWDPCPVILILVVCCLSAYRKRLPSSRHYQQRRLRLWQDKTRYFYQQILWLYIVGGMYYRTTGSTYYSDIYRYDPARNSWLDGGGNAAGRMKTSRYDHAVAPLAGVSQFCQ